eukprot:TRINITY_DN15505_c0_g1_i4.p1 TRINITY_DN15505_c0_g1~~TRINITY_DN15505_c0_g1_i4.p1  ORF type:complete len:584 (-),score=101.08 TRINITY_DN15505_c0_g1_i4:353-2104(-)
MHRMLAQDPTLADASSRGWLSSSAPSLSQNGTPANDAIVLSGRAPRRALEVAVLAGNLEAVRTLLAMGVKVRMQMPGFIGLGSSLVDQALLMGEEECGLVHFHGARLQQHRENVLPKNLSSSEEHRLLRRGAAIPILQQLLGKAPARKRELMSALQLSHFGAMKAVVSSFPGNMSTVSRAAGMGRTPLHLLVGASYRLQLLASARRLVSQPVNFEGCGLHDSHVEYNFAGFIEDLLAHRSINVDTLDGHPSDLSVSAKGSPLHVAALTGQAMVAAELMKAGASVSLQDSRGATPLHLAAASHSESLLFVLLEESDQRVTEIRDHQGRTALHYATLHRDLSAIKQLVAHSPDGVRVKDNQGRTPMELLQQPAPPLAGGTSKCLVDGQGDGSWADHVQLGNPVLLPATLCSDASVCQSDPPSHGASLREWGVRLGCPFHSPNVDSDGHSGLEFPWDEVRSCREATIPSWLLPAQWCNAPALVAKQCWEAGKCDPVVRLVHQSTVYTLLEGHATWQLAPEARWRNTEAAGDLWVEESTRVVQQKAGESLMVPIGWVARVTPSTTQITLLECVLRDREGHTAFVAAF